MTSPAPQPLPAFDVVLRGFHRHQVDGLIDRVNFTLATLTGAPVFTDAAIPIAGLPPEQNPDPITAQELRRPPWTWSCADTTAARSRTSCPTSRNGSTTPSRAQPGDNRPENLGTAQWGPCL